jgi:TPP-dependent indolepyruvate ferredoxin oxidoreductase alpha subunit
MAIRAAIAAGVNITYKILYNDAVAMTGGQPRTKAAHGAQIARQMPARARRSIAVVSDEPDKYPAGPVSRRTSPSTTATSSTPCSACLREIEGTSPS